MGNEYENYLKSDAWRRKREQRFHIDGYRWVMCGAKHSLQAHHLTYNRIYHEDVRKDLVTLCKRCHNDVHGFLSDDKKYYPKQMAYENALHDILKLHNRYERTKYYNQFRAKADQIIEANRIELNRERLEHEKDVAKNRTAAFLEFDRKYGHLDVAERGRLNFCDAKIGAKYGPLMGEGSYVLGKFYNAKHTLILLKAMEEDPNIRNIDLHNCFGVSMKRVRECRKAFNTNTVSEFLADHKFTWNKGQLDCVAAAKEALKRKGLL